VKLEFCGEIFKKSSNIKFNENCPVGTKLFNVDRQAGRQT
jgi:hypothetical protein